MLYRNKPNILILLGIVISILVAACAGTPSYIDNIEPEGDTPTTLFNSSDVFPPRAGPARAVFRTLDDWAIFSSSIPTRRGKYALDQFRRVDFDRHMVIGVILGSRGSGHYAVTIDSVRTENQQLMVYATEHPPLTGNRAFANPAHFVVVERVDLPVEFAPVVISEARRP